MLYFIIIYHYLLLLGDHRIDVSYVNMAVPGSPFTARAWEASKVIVSGVRAGRVGKANSFNSKCEIVT